MIISNQELQLNEQQQFLSILHHDNRNSYVSRFVAKVGQHSAIKLNELEEYSHSNNIYVSINGFTKYGRKSEDIRQINAIYFDLDMHNKEILKQYCDAEEKMGYIDECVGNTLNLLYDAILQEEIPEPTMITNTGRGLGIFYVLDRSIACAKGKNEKQVNYWKQIYYGLASKFKSIINAENNELAKHPEAILEFDEKVVADVSRVVRMPMTYNQAIKKECHLLAADGNYYSLKELSKYTKYVPERMIHKKENIVMVDFQAMKFHQERMKCFEDLQELRSFSGNGHRDYMCFCYYNEAVQVYGTKQATIMVEDYNKKFTEPLKDSEIKNLIKGVDNNKGKNHAGFYKLTNKWIVENCEITPAEQEGIGINLTKRQIERQVIKEKNHQEREERNLAVISYAQNHTECPYKDIAVHFGISLATVKRILKMGEIRRYSKQNIEQNNEIEVIENKEMRVENLKKWDVAKSVKKCPIVCCVPSLCQEIENCFNTLYQYALWQFGYMGLYYNFSIYQENEYLYLQSLEEIYEIGKVSEIELFIYQNYENDIHNIACGIKEKIYLLQFQEQAGQVDFIDVFEWDWREMLL